MKDIIVQKFGGTSVADTDKIKNVAKAVIREKNKGNDIVVVVFIKELFNSGHAVFHKLLLICCFRRSRGTDVRTLRSRRSRL